MTQREGIDNGEARIGITEGHQGGRWRSRTRGADRHTLVQLRSGRGAVRRDGAIPRREDRRPRKVLAARQLREG